MQEEISVYITKEELLNYFNALNSFIEKEKFCNHYISKCQMIIRKIRDNKDNYYKENGKLYLKKDLANNISWLNQNVKMLNAELSKARRINKRLKNEEIRKSIKDQCYTVCPLTQGQAELLSQIESFNKLSDISTNDLVTVYKYALKNIDSFSYEFFNSIHRLFKIKITKCDISVQLSSLKNWIKHEQLIIGSEDSKFELYGSLKREINELLNFYNPETVNYDYRYDVLNHMIIDDEYLPYLKLVISQIPEIVNVKNKNGESLFVDVVKKYISNYMKKLQNQTKKYIDPKYLEEVILLMFETGQLKLSALDQKTFDEALSNFEKLVLNKKYKKEPLVDILNSIDRIKHGKREEVNIPKLNVDIDQELSFNAFYNANGIDLTNEDTFVLNNNYPYFNYAYGSSILENGMVSLKIHVVDVASYIDMDSNLLEELKNNFKRGEDIFSLDIINQYFSLNKNAKRSVLTYEMQVNSRGKIEQFLIYPSQVTVKKVIEYNDIKEVSKTDSSIQTLLYTFYAFSHRKTISKDNIGYELENTFKKIFNLMVGKKVTKDKLPFIYKVQPPINKEKIYKLQTKLVHHFAKIDEDSFRKISQIIELPMNNAYYSQKNIGHVGLNYRYYMDLLNTCSSYIGILIQYALKDYYVNNKRDSETIVSWDQQFDSLSQEPKQLKKAKMR